MTDNSPTLTVRFDVGGTIYKVSRSLLEAFTDTMLARMASETWQKDNDTPMFIERDGARFRFCLDYMRDGRVDLSPSVSKNALLTDLKYYGFENVNLDVIEDGSATFEAAKHLASVEQDYQTLRSCMELAHLCFQKFSEHGHLIVSVSDKKSFRLHRRCVTMYNILSSNSASPSMA
jgi:hypothetical protein